MYSYDWTDENGIFRLSVSGKHNNEIRPVYKQELDLFGFNLFWDYPDTDKPLLWAENVRRYMLNGELVAEAQGGGFYTKPTIKIHRKGIELEPINTDRLYEINRDIMLGLEQTAVTFVRKQHNRFKKQNYQFVCAFSGGKDSLVLLDIVNKALSPDEYYVIFGDTGMELSCTYNAVEKAKELYPQLKFYTASCDMTAEESWDKMGVPAQRLRWCCQVHKSVPMLMKIREVTGGYDKKVVVYDGICATESARRAQYDEVSPGMKNINQVNCRPIFKWETVEIFTYLLGKNLLINDTYKSGATRVGCKVCPMSSIWWDYITNNYYGDEIKPLFKMVERFAESAKPIAAKQYVENGGWKARTSGRYMHGCGNKVAESVKNDAITFSFLAYTQKWENVSPLIGKIIGTCEQIINGKKFKVNINYEPTLTVTYYPYSQMDRFVVSSLRAVANKVAYCIGCKACVAHCPHFAFTINDEKHINIRIENCTHCGNCVTAIGGKGCLVAKSLMTTQGDGIMGTSGLDKYARFGFRKAFLQHFFELKSECFSSKQLGNRQYDALKVWLKESGLLETANKGEKIGQPTDLFRKLEKKGLSVDDYLTWAVIWTNLAYNSKISKWYMLFVQSGQAYEKGDLVFMLGDEFSESTRDNAVTALLETFRESPIGSVLKQGIPIKLGSIQKYSKMGWETPDSIAILYTLYRFAEETSFYSFSLTQLAEMRKSSDSKGMDPVAVYGIFADDFKEILQELAVHYPQYLSVSFQAGLDSIRLFENIKSVGVLDLVKDGGND